MFVDGISNTIIYIHQAFKLACILPPVNSGPAQIQPLDGHCCPMLLARTECLNDLGMVCPSPAERKLRFCSEYLSLRGVC